MIIKILLLYFSEMIEAVGHEFMEDFFGSCESVLAENGLFVLQVGSLDCSTNSIYDKIKCQNVLGAFTNFDSLLVHIDTR